MPVKCENCGAPMGVVEGKGYFFCDYCYSFHFEKAQTPDGVVVLDDAGKLPCPVCDAKLVPASLEEHRVLFCQQCHGILLKQKAFAKLVEIKRAQYEGRKIPVRKRVKTEELARKVSCPLCKREMVTHPYYGPGEVVIDSCSDCYMIWLDDGELSTIERAR